MSTIFAVAMALLNTINHPKPQTVPPPAQEETVYPALHIEENQIVERTGK